MLTKAAWRGKKQGNFQQCSATRVKKKNIALQLSVIEANIWLNHITTLHLGWMI